MLIISVLGIISDLLMTKNLENPNTAVPTYPLPEIPLKSVEARLNWLDSALKFVQEIKKNTKK